MMKKIIKKTAFILIFCFSTVYIFSPLVFAGHNDRGFNNSRRGNGVRVEDIRINRTDRIITENKSDWPKIALGFGGILLIWALLRGPSLKNNNNENDNNTKILEILKRQQQQIENLESKISEKKQTEKKSEEKENDWSLFEERHKEKEKGIEIWKRRGEDNQKNKKIKPATKSDDNEEEENDEDAEEEPKIKIKEVNF